MLLRFMALLSAVGNPVAEGQETVSEVDIFKLHTGDTADQFHIGKIPKAPDA